MTNETMTATQETLITEGLQFITGLDEQNKEYTTNELVDFLTAKAVSMYRNESIDVEAILAIVEERWCGFDQHLNELYALTEKQAEEIELTSDESKRYMELVNYLQDNNIAITFAIEY